MNALETSFNTGATLYDIEHHPDGRWWNFSSAAWEAFNAAHWAQYAIPLTEVGASGYYRAAYPITAPGVLTTGVIYEQEGVSPVIGDGPVGIAQSQGVDVYAVATSTQAAANLQLSALSMVPGTIIASGISTAQRLYTSLTAATDVYGGRILVMCSGACTSAVTNIASFNPATGLLTIAGSLPSAPAVNDVFIIV